MIEVRHGHDWEEFPVMDTNPEWHTRKCRICGDAEERFGPTIRANGPSTPGTEWKATSTVPGSGNTEEE